MRKIATLAAALMALGIQPVVAGPLDDRLFEAVRSGDHAQIKALTAKHADVNRRLYDKSTVLSWAVDRQDEESVALLLAAGARVNLTDAEGTPPIILACEGGDPAILGRLLAAGADVRKARWDGAGVLSLCAGSSTPDIIAKLIASGLPVDEGNPEGQTPLMFAAARGKIANARALIGKGANVNARTQNGFTPLFFAIKSGVDGAVQAIVEAGGDLAYVAPDGTTALHLALFAHNMPAAKYLVEHGADLQRWDITGKQPLHVAAERGDTDFARLLLSKGASPDSLTKTAFGAVPHQPDPFEAGRAAKESNAGFVPAASDGDWKPKIVYMTLDGGVLPVPPPPATPLLIAARTGSVEMMKTLVEEGAKPSIRGPDGMTVLLAASGSGKLAAVEYAMEIDPDLTATAGGSNVMHMVLSNPKGAEAEAIMQYLADHGAPLDGKNNKGQSVEAAANRATPGLKALYARLIAARTSRTAAATQTASQ